VKTEKKERILYGNGVSPGIIFGTALRLDRQNHLVFKTYIGQERIEKEVQRLVASVEAAKRELETLRSRLEQRVGREHSYILDAHRLMLEDRNLLDEVINDIRQSHVNAEWAVRCATDRLRQAYESLEDEYFRERASDIRHATERILLNLAGDKQGAAAQLPENSIVMARYFNPSSFALPGLAGMRGLALESGGRTSHTAIIARGLRLPAVMEIKGLLSLVATGDSVLVDGDEGILVLNPDAERLRRLQPRIREFGNVRVPVLSQTEGPAMTLDGVAVSLRANAELVREVQTARQCRAEGIGLFRSEYLFSTHSGGFPSAEQQLEAYRELAEAMLPHPVAIRTLDALDEQPRNGEFGALTNPSLGLRGVRLSLRARAQFEAQVQAIYRASRFGNLEMVLPMVSSLEELWEAKSVIRDAAARVENMSVPLGLMIEVPAAVMLLDLLAPEVDFLCVGTNDLVQYTLAVDRANPAVAALFQPLHPAIIQSLVRIAESAERQGKRVRVCGEIAANPFYAAILLGMGYRDLSMNAYSIPIIRRVIGALTLEQARSIFGTVQSCRTALEAADCVIPALSSLLPFDLSAYTREIRKPSNRQSGLQASGIQPQSTG